MNVSSYLHMQLMYRFLLCWGMLENIWEIAIFRLFVYVFILGKVYFSKIAVFLNIFLQKRGNIKWLLWLEANGSRWLNFEYMVKLCQYLLQLKHPGSEDCYTIALSNAFYCILDKLASINLTYVCSKQLVRLPSRLALTNYQTWRNVTLWPIIGIWYHCWF